MINYANNDVIVAPDGKWLDFGIEPQPSLYHVYTSGINGSVTAVPNFGITDDIVSLSNTPDYGYEFSNYTVTGTGAVLSGNSVTIGSSDVYVEGHFTRHYDPYNPLNLPPYTIRFKVVPYSSYPDYWQLYNEVEEIDPDNGIYQICIPKNNWSLEFSSVPDLLEIVGANSTGVTVLDGFLRDNNKLSKVALFDTTAVTDMNQMFDNCPLLTDIPSFSTSNVTTFNLMFRNCTSLEASPLYDTSNATILAGMFEGCTSLKTVPLFNTSKATTMNLMFDGCVNVESGAYDLYSRASSQSNPPANHVYTFRNCGTNTINGTHDLYMIPSDWK